MPRRWVSLAAAIAVFAVACGTVADGREAESIAAATAPIEILYLAPAPGDTPAFLPAFRGAEVALAVAALGGSLASITWVEVPADLAGWTPPHGDAAIVAPGTDPDVVAGLVGRLSVPTVSLAGGRDTPTWRALAPGDDAIAPAMLALAGDRPCLVVGREGHDLAARIAASGTVRRLRTGVLLRDPVAADGCTGVLWPGSGAPGARLRAAFVDRGIVTAFLATERLRDGAYEALAGSSGPGSLVVSGASDVSTRLDLRSRRFVQDYQSQVGVPPAAYSAEGWDAAELLLAVLRDGWPDAFTGVAGRYDLAGAGPPVSVYRLSRAGWRPA